MGGPSCCPLSDWMRLPFPSRTISFSPFHVKLRPRIYRASQKHVDAVTEVHLDAVEVEADARGLAVVVRAVVRVVGRVLAEVKCAVVVDVLASSERVVVVDDGKSGGLRHGVLRWCVVWALALTMYIGC